MFGENPVRKQWLDPSGRLAVQAIFPTIQGEGPHAGRPALFIRLAGCNLRCWFCDTDFESNIDNVMDVESIMARLDAHERLWHDIAENPLIVVTGGEPFRQNIVPLLEALSGEGYEHQIETAGTLWLDGYAEHSSPTSIVCSPKTPHIDSSLAAWCWHYKYIVSFAEPVDHNTGIPMSTTQKAQHLSQRGAPASDRATPASTRTPLFRPPPGADATIWLQPCDEQDEERNAQNRKLCVALCMRFGYRMSLQQHKILGVE